MNEPKIYERLNRVFRDTLNDPNIQLVPDLAAGNLAGWDSVSHVALIVATEKEFGVQFSLQELDQFNMIADLVRLLIAKAS